MNGIVRDKKGLDERIWDTDGKKEGNMEKIANGGRVLLYEQRFCNSQNKRGILRQNNKPGVRARRIFWRGRVFSHAIWI